MSDSRKRLVLTLIFSGAALLMGAAPSRAEGAAGDQNKKTVMAFYERVLNQQNFSAASDFIGATYKQHSQNVADGPDGLAKMIDFLHTKCPQAHFEVKQIWTDGDYVIVHVLAQFAPNGPGRAVVDIFRFDHGRIVEHWDVMQAISAHPANSNGMF